MTTARGQSSWLFLMAFLAVLPACGKDPREAEIMAVYKAYSHAAHVRDGKAALEILTAPSVEAYGPLLKIALDASEEQVRALAPAQKLEVLRMRHRSTRSQLSKLDPPGFVRFATDQGWYSAVDPDQEFVLTDLDIHDDWAVGVEDFGHNLKLRIYFIKEDGKWKLNEWRAMQEDGPLYEAVAKELEMSVDDFLLLILEDENGQPPNQWIWRPMVK